MANWFKNNWKTVALGTGLLMSIGLNMKSCSDNSDNKEVAAKQEQTNMKLDSLAVAVFNVKNDVEANYSAIRQVEARVNDVHGDVNELSAKIDSCCCKQCGQVVRQSKPRPHRRDTVVVRDTVKVPCPCEEKVTFVQNISFQCLNKPKVR